MPLVSLILASIFSIFLGLILIKGMLFLENSNDFLTGIILIIGALIATFGPGKILKHFYLLQTKKNELLQLIKNLLIASALAKLVYNIFTFFLSHDFEKFNNDTIITFMIEIVKVLLS